MANFLSTMMLDEENECLEESEEIESQENVPPIPPILTPIVPPQSIDDHRWRKDVTTFFMNIIANIVNETAIQY